MEVSPLSLQLDAPRSPFDFACIWFLRSVGSLQVASQPHIQRDGNAHYHKRTYAQDQEPPNHPHSRLGYQMDLVLWWLVMTG
jgi:hypothetical protein